MGNSECEMDVGDGPQEEPEFEEGDADTPPDALIQGNGHSAKIEDDKTLIGNGGGDANGNGEALVTPSSMAKPLARNANDALSTRSSNGIKKFKQMIEDEDEAGTKEEQAEFMRELEAFYKEKFMDFKPPKFYGEPLNCLKLWRAVIELGGYDRVTTNKLWRQVGESFHPPKTCTTVSWTFRIFYEKALLEYEKHKKEIGELEFPAVSIPEPTAVENEGSAQQVSGSGRVRRDAAARAMQGWHAQRFYGIGEGGEQTTKDKSVSSTQKREKHLKNIGGKQRKPSSLEPAENEINVEPNKQLATTVVDVGPPADWVKINVRESKDCFEVYALVPGLLREESSVRSRWTSSHHRPARAA